MIREGIEDGQSEGRQEKWLNHHRVEEEGAGMRRAFEKGAFHLADCGIGRRLTPFLGLSFLFAIEELIASSKLSRI